VFSSVKSKSKLEINMESTLSKRNIGTILIKLFDNENPKNRGKDNEEKTKICKNFPKIISSKNLNNTIFIKSAKLIHANIDNDNSIKDKIIKTNLGKKTSSLHFPSTNTFESRVIEI